MVVKKNNPCQVLHFMNLLHFQNSHLSMLLKISTENHCYNYFNEAGHCTELLALPNISFGDIHIHRSTTHQAPSYHRLVWFKYQWTWSVPVLNILKPTTLKSCSLHWKPRIYPFSMKNVSVNGACQLSAYIQWTESWHNLHLSRECVYYICH